LRSYIPSLLWHIIAKQGHKVAYLVLSLAAVWLAMLLAYQTPYTHTVTVSQAAGEAFNFQPVAGLGLPGYFWGDRFAFLRVGSPGSPSKLTISVGGRTDGARVSFSVNNKSLGVLTLATDGSLISRTFILPAALVSQDEIRFGIVAPALKHQGRNLGVQVASLVVESSSSLGLGWPPIGTLLSTTLTGLLLAVLGWRLQGFWLYLLPLVGATAVYLLGIGRASVAPNIWLLGASLLLPIGALIVQDHRSRPHLSIPKLRLGKLQGTGLMLWQWLNHLLVVNGPETRPLFRAAIVIVILFQMDLFIGTPGTQDAAIPFYYFGGILLATLALLLRGPAITYLLFGGVGLAGVLIRLRWASTATASDVYLATSQACDFFLHGRNPYAEVFTAVYYSPPPGYVWYGYLPMTWFSELPFYLLGDIRWGLVFFDLTTVGIIYLLARRYWNADIGAALATPLLLFMPLTRSTIEYAFTDPIMLVWIALSIFQLTKQRWMGAAATAGLALASKQYAIVYVLILLIFFARQRRWRELAVMLAIPAVIILPYFFWSPGDFISDTVALHLSWLPQTEPFVGTWNTSLWAQWFGITKADNVSIAAFKPWASLIMVGVLVATLAVNAWRPGVKQVVATTTVCLTVLFALNSGLTQYSYWRDVVVMAFLWSAVWKLNPDQPSNVLLSSMA